ncbi:response regulator transcription factor [Reyranella sp.]|uniref:response regulator transcription factor n=1 Tax=Reyranella sp. TaxID=1929291 RepID=UPI002F955279
MASKGVVHVVEDDEAMRESLVAVLGDAGYDVRAHAHAEAFLARADAAAAGCVVSDIRMPGMDGLALLRRLRDEGRALPLLLITGHGDVALAVAAMKAGAVDFLEKPFEPGRLLAAVEDALKTHGSRTGEDQAAQAARRQLEALTPREREVLECLVVGHSNKDTANLLGVSPRTVEFHRAHLMDKTGARGLPDLVRLWLAARETS